MKKLLVTTLVAATVATGFVGQAQAADNGLKVYAKVVPVQMEQVNQENIHSLIEKIYQTYKIPEQQQIEIDKLIEKQINILPALNKPVPDQTVKPTPNKPVPDQTVKPTPNKPVPDQTVKPTPTKPVPDQTVKPTPTKPVPDQTVKPTPEKDPVQQTSGLSQEEQQMLDLVNQERSKQGLAPLKANLELTKVARVKAKDMIDNNYFSHQSPTYGSPFDMMTKFGIDYRTAGENLAGNQTVQAAHTALMNSEGHRANILNGNYTEVGIGIVNGGSYGKMFVQMFKG